MRVALFVCALLASSCKSGVVRSSMIDINQTNASIIAAVKKGGFKEIDCAWSNPALKKRGAHCFVSTLSREQAVDRLSQAVASMAVHEGWAEDYGQFHSKFQLKLDPTYVFGFGVTRVVYLKEDYGKNYSKVAKYDSDITLSLLEKKSD